MTLLARRTTRARPSTNTSAENDLSLRGTSTSASLGASKLPVKSVLGAAAGGPGKLGKQVAGGEDGKAPAVTVRRTGALGVKSSNTTSTASTSTTLGRKRPALTDTTNSRSSTSTAGAGAKPKSTTAPTAAARRPSVATGGSSVRRDSGAAEVGRRYATRSSGGLPQPKLEVESEDAKMGGLEDEDLEGLEEVEEVEEEEEDGRKSKKLKTSEPDLPYEHAVGYVGKRSVAEVEVEEMRPEEVGWEDLDEGDEEDPLMVSAYVVEVYDYLRELELTTMPDPDYMRNQNEVTWKMRGILIDWLVEIHTKFRLLPETIFLATNIIDRLLSARVVSLVKFQLVGITALFIAAKYEEVTCPSVQNFHYMTDGGYEEDEILKAERYVLGMLDFNLSYPNPINFLRRISKADGYDIHSRTMAKYLMEISIVDHKFMATTPSLIAAAGTWLARRILGKGEWTPNLVHYSGYTEKELRPTAQLMLDYIVRNSALANPELRSENPFHTGVPREEVEHPNFFKKYGAKKFFKASTSVRAWVEEEYAPIQKRNPKTKRMEIINVPAIL